ncbi:MAG: hypothetical protein WAU24_00760 [Chitinophagaceae bacterium]
MTTLCKNYKKLFLVFLFANAISFCHAQADPEFPKGFIMYGKLHTGLVTNFSSSPDLFAGGIQLAPQFTLVPHALRLGVIAGGFYSNKKLQGEFGPSVSIKLKTFNAKLQGATVGTVGNLNVLIDHLWGTDQQRLLGGGLIVDIGVITLGVTTHRDYNLNTWWFQSEVGIRLSKKHKNTVI